MGRGGSRVYDVLTYWSNRTGARIRKHLVEAEKSTFQGELFFQRSECTAGLTVASLFGLV